MPAGSLCSNRLTKPTWSAGAQRRRTAARGGACAAFTLVELLVVVAIIALLASLMAPSLATARTAALRMRCADNLRHIHAAVTMYLQANRDIYPCAQDPVSTRPFYWLWMGRGWRPFVAPYLPGSSRREGPSALFCEGDAAREDYEATSYAYSMAFYHSPEQIDGMSSPADTYSKPTPSIPQGPFVVGDAERKVLIGEWTSNHPRVHGDNGWWCWEGSRTYLFANGTVRYLRTDQVRPARDGLPDVNLTVGGIKGRDL